MTGSIIDQLSRWLAARREGLIREGIVITNRLPLTAIDIPWKGSIGLSKSDILVSYTVWERAKFQTELIIVDGESGETLRSEDATLEDPGEIEPILDAVVNDLIAGTYRRV
jgi:hypothetical protein